MSNFSKPKVEFTEEEQEAVRRTMQLHRDLANADTPMGTEAVIPQKMKDGVVARGLAEYAANLIVEAKQSASHKEKSRLMSAAINATVKAYNIHHLPAYLFYIAGMFEFIGQSPKAAHYFCSFLQTQAKFKPDKIDVLFDQAGFDVNVAIAMAKQRLGF